MGPDVGQSETIDNAQLSRSKGASTLATNDGNRVTVQSHFKWTGETGNSVPNEPATERLKELGKASTRLDWLLEQLQLKLGLEKSFSSYPPELTVLQELDKRLDGKTTSKLGVVRLDTVLTYPLTVESIWFIKLPGALGVSQHSITSISKATITLKQHDHFGAVSQQALEDIIFVEPVYVKPPSEHTKVLHTVACKVSTQEKTNPYTV